MYFPEKKSCKLWKSLWWSTSLIRYSLHVFHFSFRLLYCFPMSSLFQWCQLTIQWTHDTNQTYIRCLNDVQEVIWTSSIWFPDVFRGYKKRTPDSNKLNFLGFSGNQTLWELSGFRDLGVLKRDFNTGIRRSEDVLNILWMSMYV